MPKQSRSDWSTDEASEDENDENETGSNRESIAAEIMCQRAQDGEPQTRASDSDRARLLT